MEFLGFEAYITIDGVKVPHYEVKTDNFTKKATCWIASEEGKAFAINWRPTRPLRRDLGGPVTVDGTWILGMLRGRDEDASAATVTDVIASSSTTIRHLQFAPIRPTDDEQYLSNNTKDLGDIVLRI
ncbi:hypothetical protein LshimejAT787_0805640 [Lyophyllum shimeji]|uniref:DUF7918 domain-containing protein n=1 Tax=Lyophyllum shimeji TaxID=47721 RepID=A0A9P3PRH8_LYOSH|nr:hypothetical protein LshimejAT787_0805640 [Lyophyllum shimeji]